MRISQSWSSSVTRFVSKSVTPVTIHQNSPIFIYSFSLIQKLESTNGEPIVSEEQFRDLKRMLQRKSSSQGIVTWHLKKNLQPHSQNGRLEAAAPVNLKSHRSSPLCPGDQIVYPAPAADPQAAERETKEASQDRSQSEVENQAPESTDQEKFITLKELGGELNRLLQGKHSSQEIINWLQVGLLHCSTSGSGGNSCRTLTVCLFSD